MKQKSIQALAAAAIRKELKTAFPKTVFRVTSRSFAGGDSVDISWVDGPVLDNVRKITDKYQYGRFDGMIDMYECTNSRTDIPQVKYVMPQREMSKQVGAALKAEISKKYGVDMDDMYAVKDKLCDWPDRVVYREFYSREY